MNTQTYSTRAGRIALALLGVLLTLVLLAGQPGGAVQLAQAAAPAAGSDLQAEPQAPKAPNACLADAGYNATLERPRFCVYYNTPLTSAAQATTVANQVDQYWDRYVALGFTAPLVSGGEAKLRVQIVAGGCNGVAWENYIRVNQGCITTSNEEMQHTQGHELFHRVQFGYDADWSTNWTDIAWLYEGTARMMEDEATTNMDHWPQAMTAAFSFNQEVNNYLASTRFDITSWGMRYKSALWWKYFAEKYGTVATEPERGVDAIRRLWQNAHPASGITAVNTTLSLLGSSATFNSAFRRFTVANFAKDLTGLPNSSYWYDDEREAGNPAPFGPISPTNGGTINIGTSATWAAQSVERYAARYYKAMPGVTCPVVTASFHRISGADVFYHIVTQRGSAFAAHREGSGADWSQSFLNDGITQITAIFGGQNNAAQVDVTLSCANPTLQIKLPNDTAEAHVGPAATPGKFLAQVLVTNGSPTSPVISGLVNSNFAARVNGVSATVTGGGFIQEQYWLVIQAPVQGANGIYSLQISLQPAGGGGALASATNAHSIAYDSDFNDQILIIDRSGSMSEGNKMPAARDAGNLYVDITRDSDGLAVVGFDANVNPAPFGMQSVNAAVRTAAHTFINALAPGSSTSIGDGLHEAVNQRSTSGTGNPRCSMVLLSDGMENTSLFYSDVKTEVQDTHCPVTTIALGQQSDETLLQQIATDTGGLYFYNDVYVSAVADPAAPGAPAAIDPAADRTNLELANVYEYSDAFNEHRQRLLSETGSVARQATNTHTFLVDESVSQFVFTLDWLPAYYATLIPELRDPAGNVIPPASWAATFVNADSRHIGGRINKPDPGAWTLRITNTNSELSPVPYQVIVSGFSSLTVELLLPDRLKSTFLTGDRIPIYALLSSNRPIAGAQVIAFVTAPNNVITRLPLFDDGQHGDGIADDGLYANFYTRVTQSASVAPTGEKVEVPPPPKNEGSYRVRVTADGKAGSFLFHREALGSFVVLAGADIDQSGLPDNWEKANGVTDPKGDNDMDGLLNYEEYNYGTDPNNPDTDGGGESDGSEVHRRQPIDPLNPADDGVRRPNFLNSTAFNGLVRLVYDTTGGGRTPYFRMLLYRSESPDGPFDLLLDGLPSDGIFEDGKVTNGHTYFYRMIAEDDAGDAAAFVQSPPATPSADPFPPEARVIINNGAKGTNKLNVTLTFAPKDVPTPGEPDHFSDIADMMLSNDPNFEGAGWKSFKNNVAWNLAPTALGKFAKVYARFRDTAGNESVGVEIGAIRYEAWIYLPTVKR